MFKLAVTVSAVTFSTVDVRVGYEETVTGCTADEEVDDDVYGDVGGVVDGDVYGDVDDGVYGDVDGSGLAEDGFGFAAVGLAVCGRTFCGVAAVDVVDVDLYVVPDGLTTGLVVENVAVTLEPPSGRNGVTEVYVLVAVAGLVVSKAVDCDGTLLDAVELGTLNWPVGLAGCAAGLVVFWTVEAAVVVPYTAGSLLGGLCETGLTDGLTVEKLAEVTGEPPADWPTVVEYDDVTEPGALLLAGVNVAVGGGFEPLDVDSSVYWYRDVDVVGDTGVEDDDDDETVNCVVGLYDDDDDDNGKLDDDGKLEDDDDDDVDGKPEDAVVCE